MLTQWSEGSLCRGLKISVAKPKSEANWGSSWSMRVSGHEAEPRSLDLGTWRCKVLQNSQEGGWFILVMA